MTLRWTQICLVLIFWSQPLLADDGVIAVVGSAERNIEPNQLQVNLEVWSQANTAKQAQALAATHFASLQKVFTTFGLPKTDIQTENYSLTPNYEYSQKLQRNQMTGFRVSQVLVLTLKKPETAGAFLDNVAAGSKSAASGVTIQNLQWGSDQKQKIETELLSEAVKAAKSQAEALAVASGTKIKSVKRLQPVTMSAPAPFERAFAMKAMDAAPVTEVAPGQVKIKVEVSAEYLLK